MKLRRLAFKEGFRVIPGNRRAQAAEMVIAPGDAEGDPGNQHRARQGTALPARRGSLLFIRRGERHEIRNTGRKLLRTLNFYAPPAYSRSGEPLPRGRR